MSGGRGAGKPPLTFEGDYDATRTYLPREVVRYGTTAYMATAKITGVPPTVPASWLSLGGGSGSSSLLGAAEIIQGGAESLTSNGTRVLANAPVLSDFIGDPAVSASGGNITYAVGDAPGFYVTTMDLFISRLSNCLSTDVHEFIFEDPLAGNVSFVCIGDVDGPFGQTGLVGAWSSWQSSEVVSAPRLSVRCTGGTNRTYQVLYRMYVARYEWIP